MKTNKLLSILISVVSISLSGCANIQDLKKDTLREDMDKIVEQSNQDLNAIQPIIKIPISKESFIVSEPSVYKLKKNISVSFNRTPFTTAIRSIAHELNLNVLFDYEKKKQEQNNRSNFANYQNNNASNLNNNNNNAKDSVDKQSEEDKIRYYDREISLDFKGPVRELFAYLSNSTRYFYSIEGNSLTIRSKETFKVSIPSYPGILDKVTNNIKALGGSDISYDDLSNNLTFTADYASYKRINDFTADIKDNMSLVTMRVILLNVRLTGQKNFGIDWTKLVFGYNNQMVPTGNFGVPATYSSSSTSTSSGTTTTTTTTTGSTIKESIGAIATATGANIYIEGSKFTLSTLLNFIGNYGKSSLIQNVSLQTLSGKKAKLAAVTETPYVSSVGVSAITSSSATTSSAATDKAKSGVELEITPSYTKKDGTLTIGMNVGIYGLNSMLTLSAGTLGTFNQPETTKKTVETTIRMSPSQTAIIGGLIFNKKHGAVTGLDDNTYFGNSTADNVEKEELVVLVKPQIYEFVPATN